MRVSEDPSAPPKPPRLQSPHASKAPTPPKPPSPHTLSSDPRLGEKHPSAGSVSLHCVGSTASSCPDRLTPVGGNGKRDRVAGTPPFFVGDAAGRNCTRPRHGPTGRCRPSTLVPRRVERFLHRGEDRERLRVLRPGGRFPPPGPDDASRTHRLPLRFESHGSWHAQPPRNNDSPTRSGR
jgi:hypothetical protein